MKENIPAVSNPSPSIINQPPGFTPYQKFAIGLLALIQFTIVLDFMIISPLGDLLMKSLSLSPVQFGSVVSAYAISAGVSGIFTAGFADKYDRKKLLLFFYVGFVIGTIFCGLASSYFMLLLARVVTGIFGGVVGSILMAIITDIFAFNQRGRVLGYVQMAFAGSQILGIPVGILLANAWGWHSTFFMVAGLAFLVAIAIMLRLKPLTGHLTIQLDKHPIQHLLHTIQRKEYRMGFLTIAMMSMGGFMIMPFTSAFLVNNVNMTQEQLPLIFFCTGFSSMLIMPVLGKLSDRVDKLKIFTTGSVVAAILILIYTNLPPVSLWLVIMINMILFMGLLGRFVPATALNSGIPDARDRGAYMSVSASLQQMAGGLASLFAGMVVVQKTEFSPLENFNLLGYIVVAIMVWCIYLVYRINNLVKRKMA